MIDVTRFFGLQWIQSTHLRINCIDFSSTYDYINENDKDKNLLLIFPLDTNAGLDALTGFNESLPLSHFTWVVREYASYIGA